MRPADFLYRFLSEDDFGDSGRVKDFFALYGTVQVRPTPPGLPPRARVFDASMPAYSTRIGRGAGGGDVSGDRLRPTGGRRRGSASPGACETRPPRTDAFLYN